MKKIFLLMIVALVGLQSKEQEVIYGTVRYDGFQHITKGAYWSTRPEAKMVYEGSVPPGVEVFILDQDYFVRFKDGEHNNLDRNYIVFPKGERIYVKNGNYYAAACGNGIEYLKPVNQVKIVEKEKVVTVPVPYAVHDTTVIVQKEIIREQLPPVVEPLPPVVTQAPPQVIVVRQGGGFHLSLGFSNYGVQSQPYISPCPYHRRNDYCRFQQVRQNPKPGLHRVNDGDGQGFYPKPKPGLHRVNDGDGQGMWPSGNNGGSGGSGNGGSGHRPNN